MSVRKNMKILWLTNSLALSTLMLFTSCSSVKEYFNKYETQENATKLRVGMTKTEVIGIMGNPLKENFGQKDVFFYYVKTEWQDFQETIDETFPVVFKNNKVIGFGTEYYQKNILFRAKFKRPHKAKMK